MKFALAFMMVFVAMSHQQQFQKRFFWMGENHNQKQDQSPGFYNQPIIIRNTFNTPVNPIYGQFRGLPQQQEIILVSNPVKYF